MKSKTFVKLKNSKKDFLCALCSSPRQMRYSRYLSGLNYLQILLIASSLHLLVHGTSVNFNSGFYFLAIWAIFEVSNKLLYRKEIPCPYCGFDATWYKKDVRIAKSRVKNFWDQKESLEFSTVQDIQEEPVVEADLH